MTVPPYTAHLDTFVRDRLPLAEQWPEFRFDLPELQYPDRLNCAKVLIDDAISEGHSERIALYDDSALFSYAALNAAANRIANVLTLELGVVPGNRVLLRGPNGLLIAAAWLAVMKAGAIAVTTIPMLRGKELAHIGAKANVDVALCDAVLVDDLNAARAATGHFSRTVSYGTGDLEKRMENHSDTFATVDTARDDACLLAFTSGTTGYPKATVHFHRDVVAMADVVGGHLLHTAPDDIYVGSPPLGFTFGLGALLVFPLRFRAGVAFVRQASPDALLSAIQRWQATCLFTAPTMYRNLAARVDHFDLRSLRRCVSAGEPLPKRTSDQWFERTGIRIIDGIGSTEMIHIFISAAGDDIRPGSTGKPLPGYTACVLDDDGRPLPANNSGRLAVKGPTGCRYLADERQSNYVISGWNVTGDRYRVDTDGWFWFEARADDMIISAGYNIAGPEVEATLLEHPAVLECAVIGVPDDERGQIVKAFVVLNDGHEAGGVLVAALKDFVKRAIAPYKYPRAIEFVVELPKTPTGKVQHYALRRHEQTRAAIGDTGND